MIPFVLITEQGVFSPDGFSPIRLDVASLRALVADADAPVAAAAPAPGPWPALVVPPARAVRAAVPNDVVVASLPRLAHITTDGFVLSDRSGTESLVLAAEEIGVLVSLATPAGAHEVSARLALEAPSEPPLPAARVAQIVEALVALGVAEVSLPSSDESIVRRQNEQRRVDGFEEHKRFAGAASERLRAPAAPGRVSVIPITDPTATFNLAYGLLLAYGAAYDDGRLNNTYEFLPVWVTSIKAIARRLRREGPAVLLYSNYVWSVASNLAKAAELKALSPDSVMIHGGPSTPRYPADCEAFFASHPGVDITVRGEGEQTFVEILDALGGALTGPADALTGPADALSALATVPGISFRSGDTVVHTPDRPRMAELDVVPSPYLAGLFEGLSPVGAGFQTVETNRGCPYGCTFCDWGSATNSRIRKFDLERVLGEIEWGAQRGFERLFIDDANFGIFARDVEIAEKIAECRLTYGFPRNLGACFAKNTTKYVSQIYSILWDAGVEFDPIVSLQSMDPDVLAVVERSNIKTEAYDDLADHLRDLGATVGTELMMGLPGSSVASFSNDLQGCIDRELFATIYDTMMLPNSPMNAPDYRERYGIVSGEKRVGKDGPGSTHTVIALATSTYTHADRLLMQRRRHYFRVFEDVGILRHVARWVRQAAGIREIDFYTGIGDLASSSPLDIPLLAFVVADMPSLVPPLSWPHFLSEVRHHLVERVGLPESSAMRTALQVQAMLIPEWGRTYPARVELEHDYAAWYAEIRAARRDRRSWCEVVPPLESFGPATFEVTGNERITATMLATDLFVDFTSFSDLESPVMRGTRSIHHVSDGPAPSRRSRPADADHHDADRHDDDRLDADRHDDRLDRGVAR